MRKLKLLFLSQRFPLPMDTGGKIRTGKLLEKLKDHFEIHLVSNVEKPKDEPYLGEVGRLCHHFHPVSWKEVKKYSWAFYVRLGYLTLSRYPYTVINDYLRALEKKLEDLARRESFDVLVCDFLQPTLNFRKLLDRPTVLFQHNVESVIAGRHLETARNPLSRLFWASQARRMERYEGRMCRKFKAVVTVSELDRKILQERFGVENVHDIPTGIDTHHFFPSDNGVMDNSLVFTGSMDWLPNEDALLFFAREIWGTIKAEVPDARFSVVGRKPSRRLLSELSGHQGIEVVGRVEDVRPFISRHAVYAIPLRIGGGTRIKVYEAMAMGKPVVSTRVGTEGLPVIDGENVVHADAPEDFARAVVRLLKSREERARLGRAAREFVSQNFSWEKAAAAFARVCEKVASQARDGGT